MKTLRYQGRDITLLPIYDLSHLKGELVGGALAYCGKKYVFPMITFSVIKRLSLFTDLQKDFRDFLLNFDIHDFKAFLMHNGILTDVSGIQYPYDYIIAVERDETMTFEEVIKVLRRKFRDIEFSYSDREDGVEVLDKTLLGIKSENQNIDSIFFPTNPNHVLIFEDRKYIGWGDTKIPMSFKEEKYPNFSLKRENYV